MICNRRLELHSTLRARVSVYFLLSTAAAGCLAHSFTATAAEPLPGFNKSEHFAEQIRTLTLESGVTVHINAWSRQDFDSNKLVRLIVYALPNGNTIAQTVGRQKADGVDWHFYIQHIGAQTRMLRQLSRPENIVIAYLEADGLSWPSWRRKRNDSDDLIVQLIDKVRASVGVPVSVMDLAAHSGGGSLIIGYINSVEHIPDDIGRIVFLDANYGYSDDLRHGDKLLEWLSRSSNGRPAASEHRLVVIAYHDREVRFKGKLIVGPQGGTFRKTHKMLDRLGRDLKFTTSEHDAYLRYSALGGRLQFTVLSNPDKAILHTVMVEKNGFLHAMTLGAEYHEQAGVFWGPAAYEKWIQPH